MKGHWGLLIKIDKGKSVTFYQKILQIIATRIYEILNPFSPDIKEDIFKTKISCYNTPNKYLFSLRNIKTFTYEL